MGYGVDQRLRRPSKARRSRSANKRSAIWSSRMTSRGGPLNPTLWHGRYRTGTSGLLGHLGAENLSHVTDASIRTASAPNRAILLVKAGGGLGPASADACSAISHVWLSEADGLVQT